MNSAQNTDFANNPQVTRVTLQRTRLAPAHLTAEVEVRRITMEPGVAGGYHLHNGPVFGHILEGSAVYQIQGEAECVLRAGDVFYEPSSTPIARFDATDEGVVFIGHFLLEEGQDPAITT
ncbi:cupin domain-containing protein [Actinospica sp.]|uniref:cupin domain-containing protein n=1 Tax=Actinospica sp. TaxID=1872142 RepID=UPI002BD222A7|nr:cupin domain-containing protein [Actinospica sp.]HWG25621.1 cupin domain-containing protein [Actinospica sp.]